MFRSICSLFSAFQLAVFTSQQLNPSVSVMERVMVKHHKCNVLTLLCFKYNLVLIYLEMSHFLHCELSLQSVWSSSQSHITGKGGVNLIDARLLLSI